MNYRIHTDAIKENPIIPELTPAQKSFVYADKADLLNVALFGQTAKEWRNDNPGKNGNIRDYTDLHHLLVLANLDSVNCQQAVVDFRTYLERFLRRNCYSSILSV